MRDERKFSFGLSSTIFCAQLWEQWRISRLELLVRMICAGAILILLSVAIANADGTAMQVLRGILIFLIGFAALFSASWTSELDSGLRGFPYRLGFTRPIATRQLVIVPVIYSMCWSLMFFIGGALAIYLLTGLSLPLVGPSAIIACTVCMLIAGAWVPMRTEGRIAGMAAAVAVTMSWLWLRDYCLNDPDPILLSIGKTGYFDLAWYEYLGLPAVGSLSIWATIKSVDLQRHGETLLSSISNSRLIRVDVRVLNPTSAESNTSQTVASPCVEKIRLHSFNSPGGAQIWYEVRRSAPLLLVACMILPTALFAFLCVNVHWELAPRVWLGALVVIPIVFQLLAADRTLGITSKHGLARLSPLDATRPMRCDQLIGIKVLVVFGWSLCGFLLVAIFAGLFALLSGEYEFWLRDFHTIQRAIGSISPIWWMVGLVDLLFIFLSSTTLLFAQALWMSRYPRVLLAGSLILLAHVGIFAWDASHGWQWGLLWKCYGIMLPVAVIVGSLLALVVAIRAGYLGKSYFGIALGVWLVYVASTLWLFANSSPPQPIAPVAYLVGVAMLIVPLAGAAFAPLALAAHRHG